MVNSLDDILYINSFDRVARFLGDIDTVIENKDTRFIILGNLLILNENEEQIIEKDFNLLKKSNYFYSNTNC